MNIEASGNLKQAQKCIGQAGRMLGVASIRERLFMFPS
jgi:hypothetical protein